MRSRRHFFTLSLAALAASAVRATWLRADPLPPATPIPAVTQPITEPVWIPVALSNYAILDRQATQLALDKDRQTWLPIAQSSDLPPTLEPTIEPIPPPSIDAPLLGNATGTVDQAIAWIVPHTAAYTAYDVSQIIGAYRYYGEQVGIDWFLAIAQMVHETGSLTSWWSQRPRRNPAGIGVTGVSRDGLPDGTPGPAPGPYWAWSDTRNKWLQGVSFPTWAPDAIPAHLGRLLAYALPVGAGTDAQQAMITQALSYRSLPASHRGSAPTITGLNGRWAVPGTTYGQRIIEIATTIRGY